MQAQIDQCLHFDSTTTSHIEDYNAKINKCLDAFTENLEHIYKSLELYQTKQYANYKACLESVKPQTPI